MSYRTVTIGNFDGCHLGHQALIRKTLEQKKSESTQVSMSMSFDPHPDDFFNPNQKTTKLFTAEQKKRALLELGIDEVEVLDFNDQMRSLSAEDFYQHYLLDKFKAKAIAVGQNFRFGKNRGGNSKSLEEFCRKDGVLLSLLPELEMLGDVVSSTRIRNLLTRDGDVELASQLLGRPYLLQGTVSKGRQLGRTLGFPTANISKCDQIIPLRGVYAAFADLGDPQSVKIFPDVKNLMPAMVNIGYRPTVAKNSTEICIEAHLIVDHLGENQLYDKPLSLYFIKRLRDESKFDSVDKLKEQLKKDKSITLGTLNKKTI